MKARIWYRYDSENCWWNGFIGFEWAEQTAKLAWVVEIPTMPSKEATERFAHRFVERFGIDELMEVADPYEICIGFGRRME